MKSSIQQRLPFFTLILLVAGGCLGCASNGEPAADDPLEELATPPRVLDDRLPEGESDLAGIRANYTAATVHISPGGTVTIDASGFGADAARGPVEGVLRTIAADMQHRDGFADDLLAVRVDREASCDAFDALIRMCSALQTPIWKFSLNVWRPSSDSLMYINCFTPQSDQEHPSLDISVEGDNTPWRFRVGSEGGLTRDEAVSAVLKGAAAAEDGQEYIRLRPIDGMPMGAYMAVLIEIMDDWSKGDTTVFLWDGGGALIYTP